MASSAIKRQRRAKRVDTDGDPEFQVAPMVDVLLVLMLFFMAITSTEVLKKNKNLTLAESKNAVKDPHKAQDQIMVNVAWDGTTSTADFSLDGLEHLSIATVQNMVGSEHARNPASYVVIRADKDVEYSNISDLMSACANAGVSTVTFAVISGGASGTKPETAPAAN